jgi:hypothetical protein
MIWIKIALMVFIILETGNIVALYFFPDSKMANAVGVFKSWAKLKADPEIYDFAKYLVNWVAGTKIIFILLLVILVFTADQKTLLLTAGVMIISISTFFWRLFPLVRKMDREGQIDPKNYSVVLGGMILGLILLFSLALLLAII